MRVRQAIDRRRLLASGAAALLAGKAPALAGNAGPLAKVSGLAFGTAWSISLPAQANIAGLRERLEALFREIDLAFSPWRADSAIGRFNRGDADEISVSAEIVEVTDAALLIAGASGGRFDPTVGPLVARWGFGPIHDGDTPSEGWRGFRAGNGFIARSRLGLTLDLCGIAKGHALDRATALLLDAGHDDFLIDLGGELAARGRHPSGRRWQVGIEDPLPDSTDLAGMLRLDGMAVATSGDRANGYDLGPRRYSHIIDPATREPVTSQLASVSVLMPQGREADGWATALMAAGDSGPQLARSQDITALFLFRDGNALRSVATGTFERHLA